MTAQVILKRSSVAGKIPTINDLEFGELAINYKDGKLYFKTSGDPGANPPIPPSIANIASSLAGSVTSVVGLTGDINTEQIVSAITTSNNLYGYVEDIATQKSIAMAIALGGD